jgi:hypothetical protein
MEMNFCEAVLFTRSRPKSIAPQPTSPKTLADPNDEGISELEAVNDGQCLSTSKLSVSCCMDTTFSYLSGYQLIETSSSITPHTPPKLDACHLCARVFV